MPVTADRSSMLRRAAACLLVIASLGSGLPARAETAAPAPIIGTTTLAEARAMWTAASASVVDEGHLAIGGGNGVDGLSQVGLPQVLLVTIDGVDFEALPVARYAFVDGMLYGVSAELRQTLAEKKTRFKVLTDDELSRLETSLAAKYGRPARSLADFGAGKPNVFIWNLGDQEMMLTKSIVLGYRLTLRNKALAKKVEAYKKAECKMHRQKGHTPTPVTSVCL